MREREAYAISVQDTGERFTCAEGDTLLRAALRAGVGLPYECNTGSCGTCKYQLRDGDVTDLRPDAPGLSARDRRKGRRLACQSRPTADCVLEARSAPENNARVRPQVHAAYLRSVTRLTHDLSEFVFQTVAPAEFDPGQYVMIAADGIPHGRAYSMSNTANDDGQWEFLVKRVPQGQATSYLFDQLAVGQMVTLDGPYGLAQLRSSPRETVCVAGGAGLAPMVSIARGLANSANAANQTLHFFYGGRRRADLCGQEYLQACAATLAATHYYPALSDPASDEQVWEGATGFVHEHLRTVLTERLLAGYEFYIAGPPAMTDATTRMLALEHQVPVDQLHYDRFF